MAVNGDDIHVPVLTKAKPRHHRTQSPGIYDSDNIKTCHREKLNGSAKKLGKENSSTLASDPEKKNPKKVKRKLPEEPNVIRRVSPKKHLEEPKKQNVPNVPEETHDIKSAKNLLDNTIVAPLPLGTAIVSGVEIPPEFIGQAFQFLEFCSAFGPVLDLKKGMAASVLKEVIHGPRGARAQHSSSVQLHIQLVSTIHSDRGEEYEFEKDSWLKALGEYISESKMVIDELPSDCYDRGADGYNELHFSKKLRLLNFICDEALGTQKFRNWIDNENTESVKKEKEAKENVTAAKHKEKSMKQKMHDEVAKAIKAKRKTHLSISEREAIVAQINLEAAQAHSEMLAAMDMLPEKRKRCDSVRTEPVLVDDDGRCVYWRLKCSGKSEILLQELGGILDGDATSEKWMVYGADQEQEIENYISSRTRKRLPVQLELKPVILHVRSGCHKRKDLSNRVYASDENRINAIDRAHDFQSGLDPEIPSFVKPMLQSHVTGGFWLGLPNRFCVNHLPNDVEFIMTLEDEAGNESSSKYLGLKHGLSGGWRAWAIDHELVDGDALVFQLVEPTKFKVYIIRVNRPATLDDDKGEVKEQGTAEVEGVKKEISKVKPSSKKRDTRDESSDEDTDISKVAQKKRAQKRSKSLKGLSGDNDKKIDVKISKNTQSQCGATGTRRSARKKLAVD